MMRFRRVEKDMGGMANVGLDQQHIQGKEDDVSTSESKTYIGSGTKKKVDMNKIKNTKIGDDIHYYVNGIEGRGIVVKMGSQYLDLFQQDGNVKTVNINDTFFVKDILVNKQWDNMDDVERYEALQKIHAPSPRFIVKSWSALPDDIKNLLRKDGGLSGGSGSTYEAGETKDSETQDHARTGFAQNTQYDSSVKEKAAPTGTGADEPGNKPSQRKQDIEVEERSDENSVDWKKRVQSREGQTDDAIYGWEEGKYEGDDELTGEGKKTGKLGLATETDGKKGTKQAIQSKKAELESLFKGDTGEIYKNWLESHKDAMDGWHNENIPQGTYDDQKQSHGSQSADAKIDEMGIRRRDRRDRLDPEGKYGDKFDFHETGKTPEGGQPPTGTGAKPEKGTKMGKIMETTDVNDLHDRGRGETIRNRDRNTGAAHDIKRKAELEALFKGEYRELVKAKAFRKLKPVYEGDTKESTVKSDVDKGKRDVAAGYRVHTDTGEASHCGGNKKCERAHGIRCTIDGCEKIIPERMGDVREHWAEHEAENKFLDSEQDKLRDRMSKEGKLKSDVEHGKYGNVGREPNIAVSTDTKVDVPESTGYEERPHISVEEAGKLPRATFNPHGNDELHVRGSQDSKDQPKFNQPVSQNQPVRKVGAPEQHPNSYGVRYGMKGGVKKVWCPEHQVWEETTKDWHE